MVCCLSSRTNTVGASLRVTVLVMRSFPGNRCYHVAPSDSICETTGLVGRCEIVTAIKRAFNWTYCWMQWSWEGFHRPPTVCHSLNGLVEKLTRCFNPTLCIVVWHCEQVGCFAIRLTRWLRRQVVDVPHTSCVFCVISVVFCQKTAQG